MPDCEIVCDSGITWDAAGKPMIASGFWSSAWSSAVWAAAGLKAAGMRLYVTFDPSSLAARLAPFA